ncbi:hypothetical protein ABZZ36_24090 [Actinacidiphila glaucinigra]|uniref:hypothetical protein n=1 Tax=Actinacidiphila glaucinigra TaxID=235986 RepID=UPI0033A66CF7
MTEETTAATTAAAAEEAAATETATVTVLPQPAIRAAPHTQRALSRPADPPADLRGPTADRGSPPPLHGGLRFIAAYGPRRPTAAEEESAHTFYSLLAHRLRVEPVPATYGELADAQDAYEERFFRRTPEGLALWAASRQVFRERLPRPFSGLGPLLAEALMGTAAPALGIPDRPRTRAVTGRLLRRYLSRT